MKHTLIVIVVMVVGFLLASSYTAINFDIYIEGYYQNE
jgi:hypothetical protein